MRGSGFRWNDKQIADIVSLAESGEILNKDIAVRFKKNPPAITYLLKKHSIKNTACRKIIGKRNSKHSHLREKVMIYFLTHDREQSMKKFSLTDSELKSLMTSAYKMPEYRHLRKDKRRHDPWSEKEYKFLLQHSGLKSRDWIARKLKRGGELGIKDRLDLLGISSMNLNGLTISKFREAFGSDPNFFLQTCAGPKRQLKSKGNSCSYYKIVPWVWLNQEIKNGNLRSHLIFSELTEAMALFQEWYFEGNALKKLKQIVGRKEKRLVR